MELRYFLVLVDSGLGPGPWIPKLARGLGRGPVPAPIWWARAQVLDSPKHHNTPKTLFYLLLNHFLLVNNFIYWWMICWVLKYWYGHQSCYLGLKAYVFLIYFTFRIVLPSLCFVGLRALPSKVFPLVKVPFIQNTRWVETVRSVFMDSCVHMPFVYMPLFYSCRESFFSSGTLSETVHKGHIVWRENAWDVSWMVLKGVPKPSFQ